MVGDMSPHGLGGTAVSLYSNAQINKNIKLTYSTNLPTFVGLVQGREHFPDKFSNSLF